LFTEIIQKLIVFFSDTVSNYHGISCWFAYN
jgi:hypothetical protein